MTIPVCPFARIVPNGISRTKDKATLKATILLTPEPHSIVQDGADVQPNQLSLETWPTSIINAIKRGYKSSVGANDSSHAPFTVELTLGAESAIAKNNEITPNNTLPLVATAVGLKRTFSCLLYTSPSPRDS